MPDAFMARRQDRQLGCRRASHRVGRLAFCRRGGLVRWRLCRPLIGGWVVLRAIGRQRCVGAATGCQSKGKSDQRSFHAASLGCGRCAATLGKCFLALGGARGNNHLVRNWLIVLVLLAPAGLIAEPAEFDISRTPRKACLVDSGIERSGGGKGWPYGGLSAGAYTGVFPLFVAFSQGFELAVPVVPVLSATLRLEGTSGAVIRGYLIEPGLRVRLPLSEIFSLNFDAAIHFGAARYDIGLFDEPENIGHAVGWGPVTRAGFDIGGRSLRFLMNLAGSFFLFESEDGRHIGLPFLGLEFGIRYYLS